MKTTRKQHEKIVREVIKKYGATIDLQESPFLIIEILRQFGHLFAETNDGGLPPGGVGVGGPISFEDIKNSEILREILKLSGEIRAIKKKIS